MARSLLAGEIRLHNDFIFALLVKCQSGTRGIPVVNSSVIFYAGYRHCQAHVAELISSRGAVTGHCNSLSLVTGSSV